MISYRLAAVVVESVDTGDLKSPGSDTVRVRVPSTAPKRASPMGLALFGIIGGTRRGRPCRRQGKKVSGGHFFSPGESPFVVWTHPLRDVDTRQNHNPHSAPMGLALFGIDAGLEEGDLAAGKVKKCPVDTFLARGRVPLSCGPIPLGMWTHVKIIIHTLPPMGLALFGIIGEPLPISPTTKYCTGPQMFIFTKTQKMFTDCSMIFPPGMI